MDLKFRMKIVGKKISTIACEIARVELSGAICSAAAVFTSHKATIDNKFACVFQFRQLNRRFLFFTCDNIQRTIHAHAFAYNSLFGIHISDALHVLVNHTLGIYFFIAL